ncbi:hypothetical protein BJ875DRAFT_158443 [Amylocarpus encephaloides]|uniref:Zn(2)-C6 fungal-type domain-containing protein n=1 Tax=Amylocarpus encephaloides TaxID=45428 RepID=A0A9P7YAV3_9HELO|nr:hypothetical protein BJ875DRAFT_158443 [Amylocarpus encephaloides]
MRPIMVDTTPPNTMGSPEAEPQRAPQVCSHCKSIKKGCDKKLPSCSQCIKRRAVCRYREPSEPRRYGDELVNAVPTMDTSNAASTWTSIPKSVLGRLNPSMRVSILLMNSMSDIIQSSVGQPSTSQSTSTDDIFHSQVFHIIRADGHYVEDVVTRYFNGVHLWAPIISKKRFYDRYRFPQSAPTADLSVLILVMRLITQFPSPDKEVDQDREILYLATKTLFTQVQTFIPASLPLVQASILLSRYEQAHGMIDAAYITCGTSARMAYALDIQDAQYSAEPPGSDNWFDEEEQLATWWGLVICDISIACDNRMVERPFAIRRIRQNDYLPLESDQLAGEAPSLDARHRYFVSATSLTNVGTFGRECQATFVHAKVRMAAQEDNFTHDKLTSLGRELQGLLSMVMQQTEGRWDHYAGAMKTLIVGMYTLHWAALKSEDIRSRSNATESIRVTLNTVTRMVIDIAYAFNAERSDGNSEVLAPTIGHIVRCTQQHISTCNDFGNEKWRRDFEELRTMLRFFARRWLLASRELHELNKTAEAAAVGARQN